MVMEVGTFTGRTATCRWCSKKIEETQWDWRGLTWSHVDGDKYCGVPLIAEPIKETVA